MLIKTIKNILFGVKGSSTPPASATRPASERDIKVIHEKERLSSKLTKKQMEYLGSFAWLDDYMQSRERKNISQDNMVKIAVKVWEGYIQGEDIKKITRNIIGYTDKEGIRHKCVCENLLRSEVEPAVQTLMMNLTNKLYMTSYAEDDDVVKGTQWMVAFDLQTCLRCAALDGKTWNLEGSPVGHSMPLPQPYIHEGCRCVKSPVSKTWKELGFDLDEMPPSTKATMFGPVSEELNYEEWFHKHVPEELKKRYLGDHLFALYQDGMTSFSELAKHGERTPICDKDVKKIMAQIENEKPDDKQLPKISNELALPNYDWRISTSFGKSRSSNFDRAIYLARSAPEYREDNGIYQATYSAAPEEFLSFVKLYELVSGWKSAHVMINGCLIDRKIIGNINYCYGDKCRSGNPDFCFGASIFTKNPFGCHRLQISAYNNPWVEFFNPTTDGTYQLDKLRIKKRIDSVAQSYNKCPAFDYDSIIDRLNSLLSLVSKEEYTRMMQQYGQIGHININISV